MLLSYLLKAGKPENKLDSFLPVSLTSCVVKTVERVIVSASTTWVKPEIGFPVLKQDSVGRDHVKTK